MKKGLVEEATLGELGISLGREATLMSPFLSFFQDLVFVGGDSPLL